MAVRFTPNSKMKVFYYSSRKGFVQIHTVKEITMSKRINDIRGIEFSMYPPKEVEISITLEKMINGVMVEADLRFTGGNVNIMQFDGDSVLIIPFDIEKIFEKQ